MVYHRSNDPRNQTTEEWLRDYEAAEAVENGLKGPLTEEEVMAIIASDKGGSADFEPAPAGNHVSRCVSIIDLGTQENEYLGEISWKHQVFIMFELPLKMKTFKKDDQEVTEPFTVSGFYTLSLNEKANLCQLLEGWRGRSFTEDEKDAFDISVLAGRDCLVNVVRYKKKNGSDGAKIASISQLPDGMECPPQVHPLVVFSLSDFDQTTFDNLSDGLKKIVMKSHEYQVISGQVGLRPEIQDRNQDAPLFQSENPAPAPDLDMNGNPLPF